MFERCAAVALSLLVFPAAQACVQWNTEARQGALLWGRVAPGSEARLDGEALDVLPDGTVFFGLGRDAPASVRLAVVAPEGEVCTRELSVSRRDYRIQHVEGVPQETVDPPAERLARIRAEAQRVQAARGKRIVRSELPGKLFAGVLPPAEGPISGVYGSQRFYNGEPGRPHYGLDIAAPEGAPVVAPADGVVTLAEPDLFFSGGTVILDHGYRLSSTFLHMSELAVAVGDEVAAGELIGRVGDTGRATGPHLDWRMNWRGQRIDPQLLLSPVPTSR